MKSKILTKLIQGKWYLPVVLALALLDAWILIVPNEALLISAVLGRPKRRFLTVFLFTLSSAVGATLLALCSQQTSLEWVRTIFPQSIPSSYGSEILSFTRQNGGTKLFLTSMTPVPQHWAVIVAGLNQMPLANVFVAILLGRGIKYGAVTHLSRLCTRAPSPFSVRSWLHAKSLLYMERRSIDLKNILWKLNRTMSGG